MLVNPSANMAYVKDSTCLINHNSIPLAPWVKPWRHQRFIGDSGAALMLQAGSRVVVMVGSNREEAALAQMLLAPAQELGCHEKASPACPIFGLGGRELVGSDYASGTQLSVNCIRALDPQGRSRCIPAFFAAPSHLVDFPTNTKRSQHSTAALYRCECSAGRSFL